MEDDHFDSPGTYQTLVEGKIDAKSVDCNNHFMFSKMSCGYWANCYRASNPQDIFTCTLKSDLERAPWNIEAGESQDVGEDEINLFQFITGIRLREEENGNAQQT